MGKEYLIKIKVKPNSKKESIEIGEEVIEIKIKEKPEKGKANKRIIEILSNYGVKAIIKKGAKSRIKILSSNKSFEEIKKLIMNQSS